MVEVGAKHGWRSKPESGLAARTRVLAGVLFAGVPLILFSVAAEAQSSPHMSKEMRARFQDTLLRQYRRCWSAAIVGGSTFRPVVHVHFAPDGSLIGAPELKNRPTDEKDLARADAALRAVRVCNPLRIPDEFKPFYEDWQNYILRFNENDMTS
ncbi:hypothetical protein [Methylovirgula sp. 4M-Z18]|uniref:hypothetical protein n=1 Tax=Methylovirgula sp. 4M-Z18 TaxID=2293567 RepID=UPI000E2FC7B1|nr:hypothetical protein [Methylovirgula sp. 4M-Z18]RFB75699.1 hypothetical protein DYH55_21955 [Methylovirgula sp. 4M-Z18]